MYSSPGTIQGPGYGSRPRAMSHKLRTHGLETTSEPTGSMSYSGTTPAGTLRESTPSYTRPTNSPVSLQLSGGAQLRAQRGPKPLLDGHTSSTDSNLRTIAIYDGTPCTSHINFLVTLQGPDDPTPRTIESLQLSTNESMSDFDDSTANGSPCPSPGHNCFTGSPTTSGCKATQVWESQKLFPDGHSSNLPTTSSEEFPCSSIGSASNVKARLRWNLTTSDMGVTDSGAANVIRERCGRHRCIPRKAPLTIPPHQEPNFGMTSAVPLVEASDKLGGYSIASTGYHMHSVQRMRNDTKVTRTCTAGMSGNSSRTLMPLNGSTPATKRCWHNGSNSAKLHREGPNPPAAENTCAKTMAADQKTITVFPKVIQPSGGGGNPRVTIHKNQPHHSQLPETSGNVNVHEDSPKGHKPFGKSTSNIAYGLLSETSSGNTPYSLDIAHSALNVPTANTNYVQGDSYAIEQWLAAQKAVTPTHCQNGKDITLLLWMVHKPVLPAANVTRYDKSHAHQKCVPGMSKSQKKGKQHHVASDPEDPNDEVQSGNTDKRSHADHHGQCMLPVGNTTGGNASEGHQASEDTDAYVLPQLYDVDFPPLGNIPSNSRTPELELTRAQRTKVLSLYVTQPVPGLKTQHKGDDILLSCHQPTSAFSDAVEPTSSNKGHHDLKYYLYTSKVSHKSTHTPGPQPRYVCSPSIAPSSKCTHLDARNKGQTYATVLRTSVSSGPMMHNGQDAHKAQSQASVIDVKFWELADINMGTPKVHMKMTRCAKRHKATEALLPWRAATKAQHPKLAFATTGLTPVGPVATARNTVIIPMPMVTRPLGTSYMSQGPTPSAKQEDPTIRSTSQAETFSAEVVSVRRQKKLQHSKSLMRTKTSSATLM